LPKDDSQLLQFDCFKNLLTLCRDQAAVRNEALAGLATVIAETPDVFQASRIAMTTGIIVEWGADPAIAAPAILDRLGQWQTASGIALRINPENEASLFAEAPDEVKIWKALRYLIMPAMTMLCLDVKLRRSARIPDLYNLSDTLAGVHREVRFLQRLINLVDDEELIVLHPLEHKGFRIRLEAIASNFHIFSLLQGTLVGEPAHGMLAGPRPNRKVIATATGEMPHDRLITDTSVWQYASWTALRPNGTLASETIAGEVSPREIPIFEGDRVVLLGPPLPAARGWDSSFFTNLHDVLRSKVEVVEILSADEVSLRLRRIHKGLSG
jgi:hypothetical protein